MLEMLLNWYRRRFNDPQAVALFAILLTGFAIIYFFNEILAPLLIAIVLAYLLEWPTAKLTHLGLSRTLAVTLVLIGFIGVTSLLMMIMFPIAWQQAVRFVSDLPNMFNQAYNYALELPAKYPTLLDKATIDTIAEGLRVKLLDMETVIRSIVKFSMASLVGFMTIAIYAILIPLMVFFLLKDKHQMQRAVLRVLPRNSGLAGKVWVEMNQQITNYIRGKVIEIIVVTSATYILFLFFELPYSLILAIGVGLAVVIPYIGAVIATVPVVIIAIFQWGVGPDFWWFFFAYLVVQGLDTNLLVPLLFSEVVNLHPLVIIMSVIIFGGLWGFWGVFFAIPLATLFKAVIHAWPDGFEQPLSEDNKL